MYCKHCGSEMPDDAIFCSHCGTRLVPVEEPRQSAVQEHEPLPATAPEVKPAAPAAGKTAEEPPRKPFLEGMQWNVSEYPDSNVIEKTEDIDFNWNTDPDTVRDHASYRATPQLQPKQPQPKKPEAPAKSPEGIRVSEIFDRVVPAEEVRASVAPERKPQPMPEQRAESMPEGADDRGLGRFHTVKQKNAEFQQLLDKEYEKIKVAGTIGSEQNQADAIASERFDSRQENMTMDQFLQQEGAVKLYEPKPLESDVLARIEAQEKRRARQKAEAEARAKALEEARAEAAAAKQAEIDRLNSEAEASAAAAEEIRLAEEEEIRRRTEAEAKRKAEAEAARLEAIASRKAALEQAALLEQERRAAEEARAKVEAEERARAEAQAKAEAEAEAARAAEEAARQKAEAELNAAREAARIRAQQEANAAAREEEMLRQKQAMRARQQQQENEAVVQAQVRDALAQTAKMREEEEAKIKAALAGIRGGRFSNIIASGAEAAEAPAEAPAPTSFTQPAAPAEAAPETDEILEALTTDEAPVELNPAVTAAAAFFGQEAPAEPAAEAFPAAQAAENVATAPEQIEEAHQATRSQIDEMARARASFFADFPDAEEIRIRAEEPAGLGQTRMVSKEDLMSEIDNTKVLSRDELHLEELHLEDVSEEGVSQASALPEEEVLQAGQKEMQGQLNEMDDLLTQFASVSMPEEEVQPAVQQVTDLPVVDEPQEAFAEEPQVYAQEAPAYAAPQAYAEEMPAYAEEAPTFAEDVQGFEETAPAAFEETVQALPDEAAPAFAEIQPEIPQEMPESAADAAQMGMGAAAAATGFGAAAAAADAAGVEKPGLEDTMIMPMAKEAITSAQEEAAEATGLASNEWQQMGKDRAYSAAGRYEEDSYYEEPKKKGGVGRTILMIILILLCIVFALELAGIGIKLLAPTSGAAEFIDNILNSLIHMITG